MPKLRTLYQAEQRARKIAEQTADSLGRLQVLTAALSQAITAEEVAEVILTQGLLALDADWGVVAVLTTDGTEFTNVWSYPQEVRRTWRRFAADAPVPIAVAVRQQRPVILESLQQWDASYPDLTRLEGRGDHGALVALPLIHGQFAGGLEVRFAGERTFSEADQTFLQTLAGLCAQALERARLYDAERYAREYLQREAEDRQRAEAALRDSEERYHLLAESVPSMVWTARPDGSNDYANQRWYDFTGLTPEQSLDYGWMVAVHPEDLPRILEQWRRVLARGEPSESELRLRSKEGVFRWFLLRAVPLRDDRGRISKWFGTSTDIDDSKRAAEALRESEERYRRIVETSAEGIWVIDAESRTTYVNLRMAEMLACSPQDMLGGYPNDFLFAEDLEAARQEFRLKRQGDDQPFDFRLRRKDGSAIWVRVANRPLYKDNGQFVGVLGMFSDITERQKLEEALRRSEHHYRALADSVPEFVFTCAADGRCDYCNQRWCDYTGLALEQTKDFGWSKALHADDAERSMEQLRHAFHRGQSFNCEYRIRKADGTYRWFLNRIVPLKDEQGQVVKWFGICTDIDNNRRLQEALQEADRRKDEFLALLAHELRHPLAAIRNAAQAAKLLEGADARLQWIAEVIDRQVQHVSRLVDDLLDVSRITRGKVALQKESVELAAVVTRAVETVRPLIEARQHELTVALPPEPLRLEADATRLVQVLENLLANATRYTEMGGRIWLTAEADRTDVILCVRDTGIGIPVELLPRIFDPFIQGDYSAARAEGGLGIGLTLVKSLVEMHGGSVHASSAGPGKGSAFVVRLPLLQPLASGPVITAAPGE